MIAEGPKVTDEGGRRVASRRSSSVIGYLLSLMLVAGYGRPWTILAGIVGATLANRLAAEFISAWLAGC